MKVVILAGGFGSRLQAVVKDVPKPMADISGTPFLELLMGNLLRHGAESFYLCVGYKQEVIKSRFGSAFRGAPVFYSSEDSPLGTGGAIKKAFESFEISQAVVMNGDTFVQMDYAGFYSENKDKDLALALQKVPDTSRYGRVETRDGAVVAFKEKNASSGEGYINAGVYLVNKKLWQGKALKETFSFEQDILEPYAAAMNPGVYKADGYFIDIGIPESYAQACREKDLWLSSQEDSREKQRAGA